MKPLHIKENTPSDSSFMLKHKEFKHFPVSWHYHSELELVLKVESSGEMIVGNYVGNFHNGNLFLLGENLPHFWKNDEAYYQANDLKAVSVVAHFEKNFLGDVFFKVPEMQSIDAMFKRAKRGIFFGQEITQYVKPKIEDMLHSSGFNRILALLEIFNVLALSGDYTLLATEGFTHDISLQQSEPLKKVYEYVMTNFKDEISQTEVASKVGMNISAFSRFFHKSTKKTFTQFVNEVRLSYACRLILEDELNISQIAYESGYRNLSNFNTQFKSVFNKNPTDYKASILRQK